MGCTSTYPDQSPVMIDNLASGHCGTVTVNDPEQCIHTRSGSYVTKQEDVSIPNKRLRGTT